MLIAVSLALFALAYLHDLALAQYAAIPGWGQAVALVQDVLYIHGGRTDPYDQWSYSSAPITNDLFSLSLSSPFNPSSPSFQYIGGCSNCSAPQGPAVTWHTLTPYNTSSLLLFGGATGPNSPGILPTDANSAVLLDIANKTSPLWEFDTRSWTDEPIRRIHQTAVVAGGVVWIVGGEKADGSGTAFSDHYIFDPQYLAFTQLPSTNGPPDITGHQSLVLSDGRLLVFGGYSPSQNTLIPFSTMWVLDTTQSNPSWSTVSVSSTSLPSPRRGFSAALVDSGKILIYGGADARLQNSMEDGWILDTTQNPMIWTSISALSQLGPRRDHFAVGLGTVVLFGFGYAQNGAASASLAIFDVASGTFLSTYAPPAAVTTPTATTLPAPGQTEAQYTPGSAEWPQPSHTHTGGGSPPGHSTGPGGDPGTAPGRKHIPAIVLGTIFGLLGLMMGMTAGTWYLRRRRYMDSFHVLEASGDTGDEASPSTHGPIPMASMRDGAAPLVRTVKDRLSKVVPGMVPSNGLERRDMLADEDSREFGAGPWNGIRRDASSGQASGLSGRRPALDRIYESLSSLRSAGGAMLDYAAGVATARSGRSREPSTNSKASAWQIQEKQGSFDPYSEDTGLVRYSAPVLPAARPRGGRQASSYSYKDPFDDYEVESLDYDPEIAYRDEPEDDISHAYPHLHDAPPLTKLPSPATLDLTRLTPVSENPSVPTLSDSVSSTSLHAPSFSPLAASGGASSSSSHETQSPNSSKRPSSIAGVDSPGSQHMRRSPSWWARFSKTPLLERALSTERKTPKPLDFRDPNPPPRLVTIEESMHSNSPDSPQSKRKGSSGGHRQFPTLHHGRSASSLQTTQTANSDTLERVANTMQIVQKDSSSSRGDPSRGPSGDGEVAAGNVDRPHSQPEVPSSRPLSVLTDTGPRELDGLGALVQSPAEMSREEAFVQPLVDVSSPRRMSPGRLSPGSKVAERVQAYERRMSQTPDGDAMSSAHASPRTRRPSGYGLAPKSPLYVANPDHRHRSSSGS